MMRVAVAMCLLAGVALAHEGVTGATKVRMDLMKDIGDNTKALAAILKAGQFDPSKTAPLAEAIVRRAPEVVPAFEERHMHPKTEALPAIWEEPDRFAEMAAEMGPLARAVAEAETKAAFEAAMKALGRGCKECHDDYRK